MVYVNNKKFACESCIKGHRSSSCTHTDRPLYEIKKKGRPVSQCQKCRELRANKRVHSKCTCNEEEEARLSPVVVKPTGRPKRFRPIAPALPNGLQDVIKNTGSEVSLPSDVRRRVDTLLNPCPCKDVWRCQCRSSRAGLDALARAAAVLQVPTPTKAPKKSNKRLPSRPASPSNCESCCSAKKRRKGPEVGPTKGPELPPIFLESSSTTSSLTSSPLPAITIPTFDTIPPLSAIHSIAGTGCTCGIQCACPGCLEHRGQAHTSKSHRDCADGCGTCVDDSQATLLLGGGGGSSKESSKEKDKEPSFLCAFFARAATLPQPPSPRLRPSLSSFSLDPTNVLTYPDIATTGNKEEVGRAFGLVTVPKLECCGGNCGCPGGMCGCGEKCDGCCDEHLERTADEDEERERRRAVDETVVAPGVGLGLRMILPPVLRSCCAGKA